MVKESIPKEGENIKSKAINMMEIFIEYGLKQRF